MPRPFLHRAAALLLALWFALIVGDPGLLHRCPTHGGAAPSHAAGGEGEAALHAEHAGAPEASPTAPSHHDAPGAGHQCSCLGDCCGATAAALASGSPMAWLAGVVAAAPSLEAPAREFPVAADHLTPFANGPPPAAAA